MAREDGAGSDDGDDAQSPLVARAPKAAPPAAAARRSNFIPSVSNFAIQYNLTSASIALPFMQEHPAFAPPGWVAYTLLGAAFVGAVVGMVVMGYLGDVLGRRRAMVLTLALQVAGALGGALLSWGSATQVYAVFAACRLLLGVGVGGMYPLSASYSAEGASAADDPATRVGWAFFWQTPGSMAPYAVALLLLLAVGERQCSFHSRPVAGCPGDACCEDCRWDDTAAVCAFDATASSALPSFEFRFITALGAVPSCIVLWSALQERDDDEEEEEAAEALAERVGERSRAAAVVVRSSPLEEIREHPEHWRTLLGTGGSWFLFDVSYYGTAIFLPSIQETIFGEGETLFALSWQSLTVLSFGIIGSAAAVLCLRTHGLKWLNVCGFILMAICFGAMALTYQLAPERNALLFVELMALNTALFFGPNVATFVLPAVVFPREVRGTFHGLSAGLGKVGAVVGTFLYEPLHERFGVAAVMWLQCILSLAVRDRDQPHRTDSSCPRRTCACACACASLTLSGASWCVAGGSALALLHRRYAAARFTGSGLNCVLSSG
jgi:PHS family inorganic phosphate transporter-like MFS transporter